MVMYVRDLVQYVLSARTVSLVVNVLKAVLHMWRLQSVVYCMVESRRHSITCVN